MNHLDYLEDPIMSASEWEKFTSVTAQELVDVLRKKGGTYYDAKAALSTAFSILEKAMLRSKI